MKTPEAISPFVTVVLGGIERRLVMDFNAQAAFEAATKLSIFDKKVLSARPSSLIVRAMVWAALLHEDEQVRFDEFGNIADPPELSVTAVGSLITRQNFTEVSKKVYQAFQLFFKEAEEDQPAKKKE